MFLKTTLKKNFILMGIFLIIMLFYGSVILSMFNPENVNEIKNLFEVLPQGMLAAFGFNEVFTDLGGFVASYLYGFILIVFPTIYNILLCQRLLIKPIDTGSLSWTLASPMSRKKFCVYTEFYGFLSLLFIHLVVMCVIFASAKVIFPDEVINFQGFLAMNLSLFILNYTCLTIAFSSAYFFNNIKLMLGVGVGINVFMLLLDMLTNVSPDSILKNFTMYSLYSPVEIYYSPETILNLVPLVVIITIMKIVFLPFFNKKNLSL